MRLGVDIGGTKLEAAFLDETGTVAARVRVPTPPAYEDAVRAIAALVERCEREAGAPPGAASVGVAHPGSASPATGLIRNANSTWLNGMPLHDDLTAALGRPVRLANDADCFALSEARDGAGAGERVVFGVILGTGVGGGIVIDGALLDGAQSIAGEWGHNPLPWMTPDERPGPACWCGKSGCIETFLSGPGLAAAFKAAYGRSLSAPAIATADSEGDAEAVAFLDLYADRLARGLASVLNVIDAHVVVLGGGVSNVEGLPEAVCRRLPEYVFSDVVRTRIVRHRHGDSSGVRGAAWLWPVQEIGR